MAATQKARSGLVKLCRRVSPCPAPHSRSWVRIPKDDGAEELVPCRLGRRNFRAVWRVLLAAASRLGFRPYAKGPLAAAMDFRLFSGSMKNGVLTPRYCISGTFAVLLAIILPDLVSAMTLPNAASKDHRPDRVLVKFRDATNFEGRSLVSGAKIRHHYTALGGLHETASRARSK